MQVSESHLLKYEGCYFNKDMVTPEYLDSLEDFEVEESDVFIATYIKSGTMWTRNILALIYNQGHQNGSEVTDIKVRIPCLEYNVYNLDYVNYSPPRLFFTHLPYYLVPRGLRNGKAKVIYVVRNPKDVLVSYYHISKISYTVKAAKDFESFMEQFLHGKVTGGSWLDHVEGWSSHRDDLNILFLTYEEMKKDLRSSVRKICHFLGKTLSEEQIDDVADRATFDKMKTDRTANPDFFFSDFFDFSKGSFLRKGTVGDWKNIMTVAQNERFDTVFKERVENLPFQFCWDINDES